MKCRQDSLWAYGFSTFYTYISNDKVIKTLKSVADFIFKSRSQSKIFSCNISSKDFVFVLNFFEKAVEYIVKNWYVDFGNHVFQQLILIHMGLDTAPFLFNLPLFYYDWEYINDQDEENVTLDRRLIMHLVL